MTYPSKLPNDDDYATQWIDGLSSLISLSKVTARVIKFNYCPPPPFIIQGPVKVTFFFLKKNQRKTAKKFPRISFFRIDPIIFNLET